MGGGGGRDDDFWRVCGVASEYDIERKWKETRLFRTAPISNNLVLAYVAQHVLEMPRSY